MSKLNRYLLSIENLKAMYKDGLIDAKDYQKAESFLAKKYCIKIDSIIRSNELINSSFRAIYVGAKKEVKTMNFLNKKRTEKLIRLIFHRVESDKSIKLDFGNEIINKVDEEVLYANIELNNEECKIFNKIKDLKYFSQLISQNFNFADQDGNIFNTRKIEYLHNDGKYKIKITLTERNTKTKEKIPHN